MGGTIGNTNSLHDLTGQTFGMLTVIKRGRTVRGANCTHLFWEVRCECGTVTEVRGKNLKRRKTWCCGCQSQRKSNRLGDSFGDWTIVADDGTENKKYTIRCNKCGVSTRKGHVRHIKLYADKGDCGCSSRPKIGDRFSSLTVTGVHTSSKGRASKVETRCDCGNSRTVSIVNLRNGKVSMCGPCSQSANANRQKLGPPYWRAYRSLKGGTVRRNRTRIKGPLSFSLTYEEYASIALPKPSCHYCHASLPWKEYGQDSSYLDRVDNEKGYELGNLLPCCARCNRGRGPYFTYNEWYRMTGCFRDERTNCQLSSS